MLKNKKKAKEILNKARLKQKCFKIQFETKKLWQIIEERMHNNSDNLTISNTQFFYINSWRKKKKLYIYIYIYIYKNKQKHTKKWFLHYGWHHNLKPTF